MSMWHVMGGSRRQGKSLGHARVNVLEVLTGNVTFGSKVLVDQDEACRENTEEGTESENDNVANGCRERSFASKESVKGKEEMIPCELIESGSSASQTGWPRR